MHAQEPHHAPITRQDDSRHAVAAARAPDPGSLYRRRCSLGQVLLPSARPTPDGPDPLVPPPFTRRTPPGVEFLQSGGLWAQVLLYHNPPLGCTPPQFAPTYRTAAPATPDERGRTPASVHQRPHPPGARLAHDDLCRGS